MKRNTIKHKILYLVGAVLLFNLFSQYQENQSKLQYAFNPTDQIPIPYPEARFAVISDIHYYDPSLGTTGEAFEACLNSDRKLLRDCSELLDLAIADIIASKVDFVRFIQSESRLYRHYHAQDITLGPI